jgi:hypothetical protein
MNEIKVSPEELEEGRQLVALFRSKGLSEYEAYQLTGDLQLAMRGRP